MPVDIPPQLRLRPTQPLPLQSVADPEEHKRFMARLSIPPYPKAAQYISLLESTISQCREHWGHYVDVTEQAYAWAWSHQGGVLENVKRKLEARRKREEAIATFALNLLTVGVGGALAGAATKGLVKSAGGLVGQELSKEFVDKAVDIAKEKVSEPIKHATEWAYKALAGEGSEDPFKPAGISPAEFGAELRSGVSYRTGTLWDMVVRLKRENITDITLAGARSLAEEIIPLPFLQEMPSLEIDAGSLKKKALLALWLAWAWARDEAYWKVHGSVMRGDSLNYQGERQDFESVMNDLLKLGVPSSVASQKDTVYHWGNRTELIDEINMPGFIAWANSMDWMRLMFQGVPHDDDFLRKLPERMVEIRVKKWTAWMGAAE